MRFDSISSFFDAFAVIEDNEVDSTNCSLRSEKIMSANGIGDVLFTFG